ASIHAVSVLVNVSSAFALPCCAPSITPHRNASRKSSSVYCAAMVPPLAILSKGRWAKPCGMIARAHEGNLEVPKAISETEVMALLHAPAPRYKERTRAYIVRLQSAVSLRDRGRRLVSPTFRNGVHVPAQPLNSQDPLTL